MSSINIIKKRKSDHLKFALSLDAQIGSSGFEKYTFIHNALPEIDFDKIDTSTIFLGKKISLPLFISCMTGGVMQGKKINKNLAKVAQKYKIPLGVGSQRVAIEHDELKSLFQVRNLAPDVPILANVGLVQLNYGFGISEYQKCVDMINADALVVHINPIQEVIQPEGNKNWEDLLSKLSKIVGKISVPVIAKEVGFGLSYDVVKRLYEIGVRVFDTAGWGGTNWAYVEGLRGKANLELAKTFSNWGISTTESIKMCQKFRSEISSLERKNMLILGSGGIRDGIDIAKALALGADLAGIATPFAKASLVSCEEVEKLVEKYTLELKVSMFGVGAKAIDLLKKIKIISI